MRATRRGRYSPFSGCRTPFIVATLEALNLLKEFRPRLEIGQGLIPFGPGPQHRGCRECQEGSPGSDAGSCPRRAPTDGLVRSH